MTKTKEETFLQVLEENYQALLKPHAHEFFTEHSPLSAVKETYEGLISIYKAQYASQYKQGWLKPNYVPYQLCPKCNGQGSVSKPPYVPGYVDQWTSSSINHVCDVCNGAKIIGMCELPQKPDV